MLEVGCERLVDRGDRPFVGVDVDVGLAGRDHRLDRERHALLKQRPTARRPVVRDLRVLVIGAADPVPDEAAYDREACLLDHDLDRVGDVGQPVADVGLLDPGPERLPADVKQPLSLSRDLADGERDGAVGDEAVERDAEIDGDQIAFARGPSRARVRV